MELDIFNPLSDEELKELKSWKSFILGLKIDPILKKKEQEKKNLESVRSYLNNLQGKFFQSEKFIFTLINGVDKKNKEIIPLVYKFIPNHIFHNDTFILSVVDNDPKIIEHMQPEHDMARSIYLRAVQKNGNAIAYIPQKSIDKEIISVALQSYGKAIKFCPESLKTEELCLQAIARQAAVIEYVPTKYLENFDFSKRACYRNLDAWKYLPSKTKYDPFIIEFCMRQAGVEGIDHTQKLFETQKCLSTISERTDQLLGRLALAYMRRAVIIELAKDELARDCEDPQTDNKKQKNLGRSVRKYSKNMKYSKIYIEKMSMMKLYRSDKEIPFLLHYC